jgi:hypothetical protein
MSEALAKKKETRGGWNSYERLAARDTTSNGLLMRELLEMSASFNGYKKLGRPYKYTLDELSDKIGEFFLLIAQHNECAAEHNAQPDVSEKKKYIHPTMPLLAAHLGISRTGLYNWRTNPEYGYSEIINEAMTLIEAYRVQKTLDGDYNTIYSIWLDKIHDGHRETTEQVITVNNLFGQNMSPEELNQRLLEDFPDIIEVD